MDQTPSQFDLVAASLRADTSDMSVFVEVLARKLAGALPGKVVVDRKRTGLFARDGAVTGIHLDLEDHRYDLDVDEPRVRTGRSKVVRGIVLKSEEMPLDDWIELLSRDLADAAARSERGRRALERLLGA